MVSCMILEGQCVVGIPTCNNQILISGIITWQVLSRQNEGIRHISNGEITQNQPVLSTAGI